MNVTQTNPETLLVCRDGQLDDEYYEAIYAEKRREALRQVGNEALECAKSIPASVGRGIVYLLSNQPEQVKHG